jgi:hypothetical protein
MTVAVSSNNLAWVQESQMGETGGKYLEVIEKIDDSNIYVTWGRVLPHTC